MRRSGRSSRGSECLRHRTRIHQNPVQRLTARCWAGGMAIDFFWSGGGINLVRTLVPIALNCSKNPGVTNAAPCTFLHEGRRADLRGKCEIERAVRRKRTLRASACFFSCVNAGNGGSEPNLTDAAVRANVHSSGYGQKRDKIKLSVYGTSTLQSQPNLSPSRYREN